MNWYIATLLSAGFLVGLSITKKIVLLKERSIQYLVVFYFFNVLFVLPFLFQVNFQHTLKDYLIMILISVFAITSIYLTTKSLKHLEISFIKPLSSVGPLVVLILGVFLLNEVVSYQQLAGIVIIVTVSFLLLRQEAEILNKSIKKLIRSKYVIYVGIGLLIGSFNAILDRYVLRTVEPITFMFMTRFFVFIGFVVLVFTKFKGWRDIKIGWQKAWWVLLILAALNIGAVYFYNTAMADPLGKVSLVSALRHSSLLVTVWLGGEILKEKKILSKVFLSLFMLIGLYLVIS